jgi:hypothetical protein
MTFYFRNVPNLEYVSRLSDKRNLSDYVVVKNIFKRAKIREDIFKNLQYFTKYSVVGDERPDDVAKKFYNDPSLDWVVLLTNNILNVYDEWPKAQSAFDAHLLEKYGSYESLYGGIHHYETIEIKSSNETTIIPGGSIVNQGFYNAPEYTIETDPAISLPKIVPGVYAEAIAELRDSKIDKVTITNVGSGYTSATVTVSSPPQPVNATATATLSIIPEEKEISSVTITNSGRGYITQPTVSFANPPITIPANATTSIGVGGTITGINITSYGDGYTFVPTVSFSYPEDILGSAIYLNQSTFTTGSGLEGSYISADGYNLYTAHGASSYTQGKIEQYLLSTPWDITSGTYQRAFTLNTGIAFTYATGVDFRPDGSRMYVSGLTSIGYLIAEYSLTTQWDISTAVYLRNTTIPSPAGIRLQDNGKYAYSINRNTNILTRYALTTAWNISSLTTIIPTVNINLSTLIVGETNILGFNFNDNGTELYVGGGDTRILYIFGLSQSWNIATLSLKSQLNLSSKDNFPIDAFINSTRSRLLISGGQNKKIYAYDIDLLANAYAVVNDKKISQIVITNPGGGYLNPPTITIQAPIPSRTAVGYAVINGGKVTGIVITDPGYNYTEPPTVTIGNPDIERTASIAAKIENGTIIELFVADPGSGYETPPTISFSKPNNIYEPAVDEVYSVYDQEWKFDGYNWYKRLSFGTLYYDENQDKIIEILGKNSCVPITNYQYEEKKENEKRNIYVLKDNYLNLVLNDIEKIMPYKEGSEQYVSRTLKKADNPRFYE